MVLSLIFAAISRVYNFYDETSQSVPQESIGQEASVLWLTQYKYKAIDDLTAADAHRPFTLYTKLDVNSLYILSIKCNVSKLPFKNAIYATDKISSKMKAFIRVEIIEAFDNSWVKAHLQLWFWIYLSLDFSFFAILKMNTDLIEMNEFEKCDFLQQSFNKISESGLLNNGPIPTHPFKLTLWRQ